MADSGKKNSHDPKLKHLDKGTSNVVSTTDVTGMIPANPQDIDTEVFQDIHTLGSDAALDID